MNNKEKTFVSAVVYTHNVESEITDFMKFLAGFLTANFENSEILCVNDSSEDSTAQVIKNVADGISGTTITLINLSHFHGVEMAMNAGLDFSIGDFVFEFDSIQRDYDESVIMDLYLRALSGYDIVSAVPNKKQRFSSRLFYALLEKLSVSAWKIETESFRILSRRVINRIKSMSKTTPYRKVAYASSGLKADSIKYEVMQTWGHTLSREEKRYRVSLGIDTLIMFTNFGYKFSISMTAAMIFVTLFMLAYSITVYAMGIAIEGWTTTILFLSIAFLGLFGILTVIIKYLQLLVDLVFKRKQYSFESIEKLTN